MNSKKKQEMEQTSRYLNELKMSSLTCQKSHHFFLFLTQTRQLNQATNLDRFCTQKIHIQPHALMYKKS